MNFKLINLSSFLLLLIFYQNANAYDKSEYFEKSVIKKLMNGNTFSSDIELVDPIDKSVSHLEEKYSFKLDVGEYIGIEKVEGNRRNIGKVIYLNNIQEVYQIDKKTRKCIPRAEDDNYRDFYIANFAPKEVFNYTANYKMLGPNVLLEVLMENYYNETETKTERIKCENLDIDDSDKTRPHKCSIEFEVKVENDAEPTKFEEDEGDEEEKKTITKLTYFFEEREDVTMFPTRIVIEKDGKTISQFNYFKFTPTYDEHQKIVNGNLPIGYGCERTKISKDHPKVSTFFGDDYELEFEAVYRYELNEENKKYLPKPGLKDFYLEKANRKSIKDDSDNDDNDDNDDDDNDDNDDNDEDKEPQDFLNRIYFNKLLINLDDGYSVCETVDEINNASIRSIYNIETNVVYDVQKDDDICYAYHFKKKHNLNYYNIQDLFITKPEFFYAEDFVYLGEYNVRNIPCKVFEKTFDDYNEKYKDDDSKSRNKDILNNLKKNMNAIFSNHAIVTHYYPTEIKDYWGENTENYNVPMKIEIRLFADKNRKREIAKLTLNIASFKPTATEYELYDVKKCAKHAYDYNWFLVQFPEDEKIIKKYVKYEALIKSSFRKTVDLSPIRINEIIVDSDENSLYVTAKLLELAGLQDGYYHRVDGKTLETPVHQLFVENEELCARRCFTNKNCAAYSYCSSMDCKIWTDDNFDKEFDPKKGDGKDYDWDKIKIKDEKECSLSKRFVKFKKSRHQSNNEFLKSLDALISNKAFNIELIHGSDKVTFSANDLKVNVQPGRHTKSNNNLDDEKFNDERNHVKYNDLFEITHPKKAFSLDKLEDKDDNKKVLGSSRGLALWECQLTCINNKDCKSMSFCAATNECIITKLSDQKDLEEKTVDSDKCNTSIKKYLALYHRHNKRRIIAKESKLVEDLSEEDCASICANEKNCLSFDYCKGKRLDKDDGSDTLACYLHEEHPSTKPDGKKPVWDINTHCDHFTYKHTREFNEFSTVKLKDSVKDIGSHSSLSLDSCASLCSESEFCNSFDYCIEKNDGHLAETHCGLSTDVYSTERIEQKKFECSTYSRIKPIKLTRRVTKYVPNGPVSGYLVTFLSFLFLVVGIAGGAAAAYFVIKYYFISY